MYRFLILLFSLTTPLLALAQSWDEVKASSLYLWGEGHGATVAEADERALADLISKITVQVESSFEQSEEETSQAGDVDSKQLVRMKVNTYSQATLTGTERLLISNEPDAIVGRYVKRSEVQRLFEGRKLKISEFARLAQNAEADLRIDDALRYYYWAYALTRSLPRPNEMTLTDQGGASRVAMAWVPEQMNLILSQIVVTPVGEADEEGNINLRFTREGQPIGSIDYSYFDGQAWSNLYSARDGRGVLEVQPDNVPANVQLKFEYTYKAQAQIDKEIESVLAVVPNVALRKSYQMVALHELAQHPQPVMEKPTANSSSVSTVQTNATTSLQPSALSSEQSAEVEKVTQSVMPKNTDAYAQAMQRVLKAITQRNYASVKSLFTPEGYEMFNGLVNYGKAHLLDTHPHIDYFTLRNEVVARSVPMSFSFARGVRKKFVEDVTFTFNQKGLIASVAFAVGQRTWSDVMSKTKWPVNSRLTIIEFLENYKTAYALKRWDYLNDIFADNALIIVGSVVQRMQRVPGDGVRYENMPIVKSNRLSKQQYMNNLRQCFNSNEFVNIRFSDTNVKKGLPDVDDYGIQLKQDYYSTHYGDTGYLFLRVDINNPETPIIRVRTWQPSITSIDDLIDLGSF